MMTTVNNKYYAVLLRFAKRRPYEFYHQKKKKKKRWLCEVIDMLINLVNISQCMHTSKHPIVYLYTIFICQLYLNKTERNMYPNLVRF